MWMRAASTVAPFTLIRAEDYSSRPTSWVSPVWEGGAIRTVPACLSLFTIGSDGRLDFVRRYDVDVGNQQMFWMGMVAVP